MGFLDIFKSKKRREYEYFQTILDTSIRIFEMVKRKKEYSDKDILDFNFDLNMMEKTRVLVLYKQGALNFFDEENRNTIVRVFASDDLDENYKKDIRDTYHFLSGFTYSMKKIVEERRKDLDK